MWHHPGGATTQLTKKAPPSLNLVWGLSEPRYSSFYSKFQFLGLRAFQRGKIVLCSIFFFSFLSEKNFSYCEWLVLPSQGSKQLAREANFVMSSRRRDITKASRANCFLPSEGKKVTNSKKNFEHSKKREKKLNRLLF